MNLLLKKYQNMSERAYYCNKTHNNITNWLQLVNKSH